MTRKERQTEASHAVPPADPATSGVVPEDDYQPPEVVVFDGDEYVRRLGPAQACSPSPGG